MSLNALVQPEHEKCESLNWRWVRANQLAPQGLGPRLDPCLQCSYGDIAPYQSPQLMAQMRASMPLRVWGYPNVTPGGRMAPLIYYPRVDPNPPVQTKGCNCSANKYGWPYVIDKPRCPQ